MVRSQFNLGSTLKILNLSSFWFTEQSEFENHFFRVFFFLILKNEYFFKVTIKYKKIMYFFTKCFLKIDLFPKKH